MIECQIDGHVALLTLNNPSANTFTAEGEKRPPVWTKLKAARTLYP